MRRDSDVAGIPATERVVVGLCHALNDQLAAVSAYVYLLERRGHLSDMGGALHAHLDRLAHSVRLVRSLARDPEPDLAPVALSLLAESATELMDGFPEGSVSFVPRDGPDAGVIRCDWTRALRALLISGSWASRGIAEDTRVELALEPEGSGSELLLEAAGEHPEPGDEPVGAEEDSYGMVVEPVGPRAVRIRFPAAP